MENSTFKQKFSVRFVEISQNGKLSLASLLNFMQEAAGRHAEVLDAGYTELVKINQAWVLSRLVLDIYELPSWKDEIAIETWTNGCRGIMANREMLITDENGKTIGAASTIWLLVDMNEKKPIRLDDANFQFPKLTGKNALEKRPGKLRALESPVKGSSFVIRLGDCDLNGHVNNTQYVRWMLDDIGELLPETPFSLQVNYQAESFRGDTLVTYHQIEEDGNLNLQISRESDNSEICRVKVEKI